MPTLIAGVAAAMAAWLLAAPASAQEARTVGGVVINVGITRALMAEHVDAQHGVHKGSHGSGAEHVIVSLADAKSGVRLAGAEVSIEVKNPRGSLQRKPLMAMTTAGFPDYSEVFDFGWSGKYLLRVLIRPKGAAAPIEARFTVNHVI